MNLLSADTREHLRSSMVVSSLAQVVEELVANSLDAEASEVHVCVDVGSLFVQVRDDGHGVPTLDVPLLGERYATSKYGVETLGSRGEALCSIARSSVVEILTHAQGEVITNQKLIRGGRVVSCGVSPEPRALGTTVTVRDLWFNQPVRQKLLRTHSGIRAEALEMERIREQVGCLALIHPRVVFSVMDETRGQKILQTQRGRSVRSAFAQLFGSRIARSLKEVYREWPAHHLLIEGYLGPPDEMCTTKDLQFLYINGRIVSHTRLHKALNREFARFCCGSSVSVSPIKTRGQLCCSQVGFMSSPSKRRYPVFVLEVRCPHPWVDVTFDPGKSLVAFRDWEGVLKCFVELVRNFLGCGATPGKRRPSHQEFEHPMPRTKRQFSQDQRDIQTTDVTEGSSHPTTITKDMVARMHILDQVDAKFICTYVDDTLFVIDQHAADERLRLEALQDEALGSDRRRRPPVSPLVPPVLHHVSFRHFRLLDVYRAIAESWGFHYSLTREERGEEAVLRVHGVPTILDVPLSVDDLLEFVEHLPGESSRSCPPPAVRRILNSKACRGAIMFGDRLSCDTCTSLIRRLAKAEFPFQCAHGRPSMIPLLSMSSIRVKHGEETTAETPIPRLRYERLRLNS